jgi:hypothetical protein
MIGQDILHCHTLPIFRMPIAATAQGRPSGVAFDQSHLCIPWQDYDADAASACRIAL